MVGTQDAPGIIPRTFHHIFDHITNIGAGRDYLVWVSLFEIYLEKVRPLECQTN